MIYTYSIYNLMVKTGDILCTTDGNSEILPGEFWRLIGRLLPGDVDHIVIYLGPGGRCIEAAGRGVSTFEIETDHWDGSGLMHKRGLLVDTLYGAAYPLQSLKVTNKEENRIRSEIAAYCLSQVGKPYNLNFLNSETEEAFYCSQLAYKAYQKHGVNLNTDRAIPTLPGTHVIIYPQEIWDGFPHQLAVLST